MSKQITQEEYLNAFDSSKRKEALEHALDIRKFEIELYWKRATYFWTFIAATLAGYAAIYASATQNPKNDVLVTLSCLGIVFSYGWFCVNRGSKQWQENWENHVDMLEDDVIGPLYKTVLKRPPATCTCEHFSEFITGPSPYSVSKINQIISLYVTVLWLFLLYKALPKFPCITQISIEHAALIFLALITCLAFNRLGKTYSGAYKHLALQRNTEVMPPNT